MSKEKRYLVTLDAYIYARNDQEAKLKSAKLAEKMRETEDNQAQVLELYSAPFGTLVNRKVCDGPINIFENKIINS